MAAARAFGGVPDALPGPCAPAGWRAGAQAHHTRTDMTRNAGSTPDETLLQHVAAHRPGRPGKIALDPELRAFVKARLSHMTFAAIEAEVAAHFPPDRRDRPQRHSPLVAADAAGRDMSQHNSPPAPPRRSRPSCKCWGVRARFASSSPTVVPSFPSARTLATQTSRSQMFGRESVDALAKLTTLPRRIPPAKPWRAAHCHAQGLPIARIARKLRVSDVAVRTYLRRKAENRERLRAVAERQARRRHGT